MNFAIQWKPMPVRLASPSVPDFSFVIELIQIPTTQIRGHCWHDQVADLDYVYAVAPQVASRGPVQVRISLDCAPRSCIAR